MKKILGLFLCTVCTLFVSAQGVEEVTLVVSGEGATKADATNVALRSAIEQTFGCFISANTTIINDDVVKDEIISVSSGNVLNYNELSAVQLETGSFFVTLQATISVTKLVTYSQNKGFTCEFAGQTFGANRKLVLLGQQNQQLVLNNMQVVLRQLIPNLFDYNITVGDPTIDGLLPVKVTAYSNATTNKFVEIYRTTLCGLKVNNTHLLEQLNVPYETYVCVGLQTKKNSFFTKIFGKEQTPIINLYHKGGCNYDLFDVKPYFTEALHSFIIKDDLGNSYQPESISDWHRDGDCYYKYDKANCEGTAWAQSFGIFSGHQCNGVGNTHPYINFSNVSVGSLLFTIKFTLKINPDVLSKISKIEIARNNSEEMSSMPNYVNEEICYDDTYDFGEIDAKDKVKIIFRLGERAKGYTYMVAGARGESASTNPVYCKEVKGDYYDLQVTYKPGGNFMAKKGKFYVPIRVELHSLDQIEVKWINIKGFVK